MLHHGFRRIKPPAPGGSTILFSDDMAGAFADNWENVGVSATGVFSGGRLQVPCYDSSRNGLYGGHVRTKSLFAASGVQRLTCSMYPPPLTGFYQDVLSNTRCMFSIYPHDEAKDTLAWGYAITSNRYRTPCTHMRIYPRSSISNLITFGYYDANSTHYVEDSFAHTYPSTGTDLIELQLVIDWVGKTVDFYVDSVWQEQIIIQDADVLTKYDQYYIHCGWISYTSVKTVAEWTSVTLEQL